MPPGKTPGLWTGHAAPEPIAAEMPRVDQPFSLPGYQLVGLLGFGGTGEVWRGVDEATGETVALKRLWEPAGPELVGRLRRDASLLEEAAGQHAIAVRDVQLLPDNEVVLVLEYAEAGSLASLLATRSRLRHPEVVTILGPLARTLAATHRRGLVHGDLTPSNVVFTANGQPKLSDFGLAIATGERRADDPGYGDPALSNGGRPGPAADVYGLAAIGYAALTGVLPEHGDLTARAPSINELAPDVPPALAAAVEAAMSPDPAIRPDAAAFASAVLRSSGADPIRFTDQRRTQSVRSVAPADRAVARKTTRPIARRKALTIVVFLSVGLSALTGAGWVKLGQRPAAALQSSSADAQPSTDSADYQAIVAHLLALRDRAFSTARLAPLNDVYPNGSAGWQVDAAALQVLRSQHLHTRGFIERIDGLTVEDSAPASADLAVTTTIPAYVVVNAAGHVVARRTGRTQSFDVVLQHAADRWLVQELRPTDS
jgi:serine/threonine protein kinase